MGKSYILLRLYDKFKRGQEVKIDECCSQYDISISTFRRYIAFLRGYFNEFYGQEIKYDTEGTKYILKNQ